MGAVKGRKDIAYHYHGRSVADGKPTTTETSSTIAPSPQEGDVSASAPSRLPHWTAFSVRKCQADVIDDQRSLLKMIDNDVGIGEFDRVMRESVLQEFLGQALEEAVESGDISKA